MKSSRITKDSSTDFLDEAFVKLQSHNRSSFVSDLRFPTNRVIKMPSQNFILWVG